MTRFGASSRGRRKRCAPALQRNSFGPLNPALINNTIPSTSTALQVTNEPAPKKPGRPRKVEETQTPAVETQAKKRRRTKKFALNNTLLFTLNIKNKKF
ncbi:hypothetical protein BpHYR1_022753 [Brachionus plicatilis]|uniref:Uncharacterized protein n=1 Tax=Brachionus plicatilis TaxID=10195 RepID=A0A3M7TAK2_BRAPC|nr:hypothetical protein BpHYR1_022753 [Brachionus plicatilis]